MTSAPCHDTLKASQNYHGAKTGTQNQVFFYFTNQFAASVRDTARSWEAVIGFESTCGIFLLEEQAMENRIHHYELEERIASLAISKGLIAEASCLMLRRGAIGPRRWKFAESEDMVSKGHEFDDNEALTFLNNEAARLSR